MTHFMCIFRVQNIYKSTLKKYMIIKPVKTNENINTVNYDRSPVFFVYQCELDLRQKQESC
jgi:hypothetical protein